MKKIEKKNCTKHFSKKIMPQFDFLNYLKKIMPHGRTTNSKEIMEHCGRRFVTIKIKLYVRRRKQLT